MLLGSGLSFSIIIQKKKEKTRVVSFFFRLILKLYQHVLPPRITNPEPYLSFLKSIVNELLIST